MYKFIKPSIVTVLNETYMNLISTNEIDNLDILNTYKPSSYYYNESTEHHARVKNHFQH